MRKIYLSRRFTDTEKSGEKGGRTEKRSLVKGKTGRFAVLGSVFLPFFTKNAVYFYKIKKNFKKHLHFIKCDAIMITIGIIFN